MGAQKTLGIDGVSSIPRVADSKSCLWGLLLLATEELMEVLESLNCDLIASWFHASPNGGSAGDHLDVGSEGLDDDIVLVADLLERSHDGLPIKGVATRGTPVGAAGMEVAEVLTSLEDGGALILLFDVHVERVEVEFHGRGVNGLHETQALVAGIQEVGFEAIEGLDAEEDALLLGVLGELLEVLNDELEV